MSDKTPKKIIGIDSGTGMEIYSIDQADGKGGTKPYRYLRATAEQRALYRRRQEVMIAEAKAERAQRKLKNETED